MVITRDMVFKEY
uniref:Hydroxymethylglutaryl-CoA synthase 1 n=1 Tax=Triatoma infestans TaxID=30076 RepID=A0A170WDH3_TRIIF